MNLRNIFLIGGIAALVALGIYFFQSTNKNKDRSDVQLHETVDTKKMGEELDEKVKNIEVQAVKIEEEEEPDMDASCEKLLISFKGMIDGILKTPEDIALLQSVAAFNQNQEVNICRQNNDFSKAIESQLERIAD